MPAKLTISLHSSKARLPYWKPLSIICLISTVLISMALNKGAYLNSQKAIFSLSNNALQIMPSEFWYNITFMGDALILIPLLSFICLLNTRMWAAMFGAVPLAFSLSHLGKNFFAIPRPAAVLEHQNMTIIGDTLTAFTSFPSGHTITIFTAMSAIVFVALKETNISKQLRSGLIITSVLIAVVVGVSRVAVGAHWPADIVMGAIIGCIAGLSGEYLSRRYSSWWNWTKVNPTYLGYFILGFCFILLACTITGKLPELTIIWAAIGISALVGTFITLKALLENET
ncbi:PAP2 family protein [Pseudoalteromonas phenolica]|uniref:undecaprenyl-diphosphate phosphatase n=1 Tax=Pseudoalteromonas phenolica TaxID=161398 RepID=A0A5R9PZL3_9GAMM|nr:phosphatase PAP2 family protein [Pseudoalteromonas phenolica]TLX46340.1 PAP2 family protein [Pseudoalteromonas phenolica]